MKFILAIALIALLILSLQFFMPKLGDSKARGVIEIDGIMQLSDCPDTPNCQGSQSSRKAQRVEPLVVNDRDDPMASVLELLAKESGVDVVRQDNHYLHATFRSGLMGFVDDVEFLLDGTNNTIQIRSASRLGKSDLGANLKRIERLRSALQDYSATTPAA